MNDDVFDGKRRPRPPRIFSAVLFIVGVVLLLGGGRLVTLGGSFYYLIAGGTLIASASGLWRAQAWGAYLYGVLTLGTVVWALIESGFDGWALAPRILPFLVLGLFLLRPGTRRALLDSEPRPLRSLWITWAVLASLVAIGIGVALRTPYPTLPFPRAIAESVAAVSDWQHWGGSAAGRRYAAFDQINASNVSKLTVAWTFRTGVGGACDVLPNNAQATPMSYVSSQTHKQYVVIAVPATGTPEDSHVAETEAQQGAGKSARPAHAGGWLIAYALPEVDTR